MHRRLDHDLVTPANGKAEQCRAQGRRAAGVGNSITHSPAPCHGFFQFDNRTAGMGAGKLVVADEGAYRLDFLLAVNGPLGISVLR